MLCPESIRAVFEEPCSEPELEEIFSTGLVVAPLFAGVLLKETHRTAPAGFGAALSHISATSAASVQVAP